MTSYHTCKARMKNQPFRRMDFSFAPGQMEILERIQSRPNQIDILYIYTYLVGFPLLIGVQTQSIRTLFEHIYII